MPPIFHLFVYPVFALITLTYGVWGFMGKCRFHAVKTGLTPLNYFKTYQAKNMTIDEKAEQVSRNFVNLFEVPVLFYALIPFLLIFDKADFLYLTCCWIYVFTRYVHTFIHVTTNHIPLRMRVHAAGTFLLYLIWVRFFIQMV